MYPKVTIVMSAYNHEQYVEKAIRSIYEQSFQDFELLVTDDGSKDSTPQILEKLSQELGFRFKSQKNKGLPKTLNTMFALGKGKYYTLIASDDYWPPNRLEEQVEYLDANSSVDMVHSDVIRVDEKNNIIKKTKSKRTIPFVNGDKEFLSFILHRRNYYAPTIMVRKSSFERVGYYDDELAVEDFDWWMRATRILNIRFIDRAWVFYRNHSNNWCKSPTGALKSINSHYTEAKKLKGIYGIMFLVTSAPLLIKLECVLERKRRYLYLFLFPLMFWNINYIKEVLYLFCSEKKINRLRKYINECF